MRLTFKTLVDLVTKKSINFGCYNFIRVIWQWSKKFEDVRITWVRREYNKPADLLSAQVIPNDLILFISFTCSACNQRCISSWLYCFINIIKFGEKKPVFWA